MDANHVSRKLISYEIPKEIVLEAKSFSVENDLLTQSFKLRRFQARKHFQDELKQMIAKITGSS